MNNEERVKEIAQLIKKNKDNPTIVKRLLQHCPDIDAVDEKNLTLLNAAVLEKNTKLIDLLLELGADVNLKDAEKDGLLPMLIEDGLISPDRLKKIIKDKANMTVISYWRGDIKRSGMLIHVAAEHNRPEYVKVILESDKTQADIKNDKFFTPLGIAAHKGHIDVVKVLLLYNPDINIKQRLRKTALMLAVEKSHIDIVKLLLKQKNIDIDYHDKKGCSALTQAIYNKDEKMIKILLKTGADPYKQDDWGMNAIASAAAGHNDLICLLPDGQKQKKRERQSVNTALKTISLVKGKESAKALLNDWLIDDQKEKLYRNIFLDNVKVWKTVDLQTGFRVNLSDLNEEGIKTTSQSKSSSHRINRIAEQLIKTDSNLPLEKNEQINLVAISVRDLNPDRTRNKRKRTDNPIFDDILDTAKSLGLKPCPFPTAALLCLQHQHQLIKKLENHDIKIAMEPVKYLEEYPDSYWGIFSIKASDKILHLSGNNYRDRFSWDSRWVFQLP